MRKTILAASLVVLTAAATNAQAERSFGQIFTECGLGGIIGQAISDKTTADVIAVITNITWDLGTTAVTSNISSPETCARGNAVTAAFILKSYAQLEKDLVLGNGHYLNALAEVVEVAPENKKAFAHAIRAEFAKQTASQSYELLSRQQKAEQLYNIVASHS